MTYRLLGILSLFFALVSAAVPFWNYNKGGKDWNFGGCTDTSVQQAPISVDYRKGRGFTAPFYFFPRFHKSTEVEYVDLEWTFRLKMLEEYIYTVIPFTIYHGSTFKLQYIEFHAPSEHRLMGKEYPLEMQMYGNYTEGVDKHICKEIAISFLFENNGKTNPFLSQFLHKLTRNNTKFNVTLETLFQIDSVTKYHFYGYKGSRTVPYCDYILCWYIIDPPMDISDAQLKEFNKRWKDNKRFAEGRGNNREVQEMIETATVYTFRHP
eukprot:TRINITY_DN543_c0_g1_i3.p1 TRINITY_DN543_c0_g1~~TRINITY_DN543_c0_g1_i3.p1  ORF type:complete len:266 (+),score=62.88 TRINITY_DN543_c0_g1_i3:176-973(+)